ncbi:MAG: xanthine dehydrogenase accessory protein XdhC [Rhodobacteraceae bacterium]|nr:xanthine dehydrogenase accessory protein XdhC [Paracoccaceae bacterium]
MSQDTPPLPYVRVTVAEVDGSAPREAGAWMRVWLEPGGAPSIDGTIGGGALEYEAIAQAAKLLTEQGGQAWARSLSAHPLGPNLGQCCGGHVRLLFERIGDAEAETLAHIAPAYPALLARPARPGAPPLTLTPPDALSAAPSPVRRAASAILSGARPRQARLLKRAQGGEDWFLEPLAPPPQPLFLYGAGHVGRALVRALQDLPFALTWVDDAPARFPPHAKLFGASPLITSDPSTVAASAPESAFHLVMTYSHAADLAICLAVLSRGRFGRLGLIGSETKRARFRKRLSEAGVPAAALERLTCPIGVEGVTGKSPAVIAISIAAQLTQWLEADAQTAALLWESRA